MQARTLKRIAIVVAGALLSVFLSVYFSDTANAGVSHNMSGYAWSDTIGWISLNSLNTGDSVNYGVNIDATGNFSGYGWSDNIGWVSFNPSQLSGCPSGSCAPQLNWTTGVVSGWARACAGTASGNCSSSTSRTDGWDGWIHLSGLTVNTTTGNFSGFAWGSDVVGWVDFSNVSVEVVTPLAPTVTLGVSPNPVDYNNPVTITWSSSNATSCTATSGPGFSTGGATSDTDMSSQLIAGATFAIRCDGPGGSTTRSRTVLVQSVCGDGFVTGSEQCDGVGGQCTAISGGFTGGSYTCNALTCVYDTTSCTSTPTSGSTQCSDGVDNDGDGFYDYDKDGDGVRDLDADPGCASAADTSEFNIGSIRPR